jgi:hypothetical protein
MAVLQVLCGVVSRTTLSRWRKTGMTAEGARRLARFIRNRITVEEALATDLEIYAAKREAERQVPYFARYPVDERRRLAAERRALREAEGHQEGT